MASGDPLDMLRTARWPQHTSTNSGLRVKVCKDEDSDALPSDDDELTARPSELPDCTRGWMEYGLNRKTPPPAELASRTRRRFRQRKINDCGSGRFEGCTVFASQVEQIIVEARSMVLILDHHQISQLVEHRRQNTQSMRAQRYIEVDAKVPVYQEHARETGTPRTRLSTS